MSEPTIELENSGPIPHLSIPVRPGVSILTGCNDAGKSQAQAHVSRLLGGDAKVSCRRGEVSGFVKGFGATITIGARVTRSGELEICSFESDLPVDLLADPGIKDPERADAQRIKALVTISGAAADVSLFYGLVGGKAAFDAIIPPETLETIDLVEMAGKIKRALQKQGLAKKDEAKSEEGQALADRGAGDGLDLAAETNAKTLQAALEAAAGNKARLDEQARAAREVKAAADKARAELAAATGQRDSFTELEAAHREAMRVVNEVSDEVILLSRQLQEANNRLTIADVSLQCQERALNAAKRNQRLSAGWQQAIDSAAGISEPPQADIDAAAETMLTARNAIERAAVVRAAKDRIAKAAAHQKKADDLRMIAHRLNQAADATDDILSRAVDSKYMAVEGGRLVTLKKDGSKEFFDRRSMGSKWYIAIMEGADRLEREGLAQTTPLVVPQHSWEALDIANRRRVHATALERRIMVLAAEAIGDEVRVLQYDPDQDWKGKATDALAAAGGGS